MVCVCTARSKARLRELAVGREKGREREGGTEAFGSVAKVSPPGELDDWP